MLRASLVFGACALLPSLCGASSAAVTPLQKVTQLVEGLKAEIEAEGKAEASSYNKFACFCRDRTMSLSGDITGGQDRIDELSADIESKTADKAEKSDQLLEGQRKKEGLAAKLDAETGRCAKEEAEYQASDMDISKAITSLNGAISAVERKKPSTGLVAVRQTVKRSLALAEAMKLVDDGPQWTQAVALLQSSATVDPDDPAYKFHSQGILDILNKMLKEFRTKKAEADAERAKAKQICTDTMGGLADEIKSTSAAIDLLDGQIEKLGEEIGSARRSLVEENTQLKDGKLYMEDLTKMCEQRAKDWDQRSSMRADELAALGKALEALKGTIAENEVANERAFVQQAGPEVTAPSLLQESRASKVRLARVLQHRAAESDLDRRQRASSMLQAEAGRLGSSALSAVARRVAADPFVKVKGLLQDLVERLLQEATDEATKKGFCDTELGKAKKDRTYRKEEATKLAGSIRVLEAKQDELELEIEQLGEAIEGLQADLAKAVQLRDEERKENLEAIRRGKEGHKAVAQAILILKTFYAKAGRATVLAQNKASPVDEHTDGPGFDGAYNGKQAASDGIIGMMEVLQSDFQRTIDSTTQEEEESSAKFVEYERASKADIAGKTTKKELDQEDLESTRKKITLKTSDLKTTMDLLDSALKRLEELRPTCIDTGMSYSDRVEKREDEIGALKRALCILDTNSVEPECLKQ